MHIVGVHYMASYLHFLAGLKWWCWNTLLYKSYPVVFFSTPVTPSDCKNVCLERL